MGQTPSSLSAKSSLVRSASEGNSAQFKAVLDSRPELLKHRTHHCLSLCHLAAQGDHVGVLEELFSKAEAQQFVHSPMAAPHGKAGNLVVELVNSATDRGVTPLMLAAEQGSIRSVRLLLEKGAHPWAVDRLGGCTALHYAARCDHADVTRMLLDAAMHDCHPPLTVKHPNSCHTKYVDMRTMSGFSAIHLAVHSNAQRALAVLLDAGANMYFGSLYDSMEWINVAKGTTPLHLAARNGSGAVARQLLKAYAEQWCGRGLPDPRQAMDDASLLPANLAARLHPNSSLGSELLPSTPLASLFDECELEVVQVGPMRLAKLAGAALRGKLQAELSDVEQLEHQQQQQQQQEGVAASGTDTCCRIEPSSASSPTCAPAPCACEATAAGVAPDCCSTDDEHSRCGVCLDARPTVALAPCRHQLCVDCCSSLLKLEHRSVLTCPFCRSSVGRLAAAAGAYA